MYKVDCEEKCPGLKNVIIKSVVSFIFSKKKELHNIVIIIIFFNFMF